METVSVGTATSEPGESSSIVVVGLGYVGLPLAVALARHFPVIGFDVDDSRVAELAAGHDRTGEIETEALEASALRLTGDAEDCRAADIYIVTVPTPVDAAKRPDLGAVLAATAMIARTADPKRRPTIVYESTVYPGVTEEICGGALAAAGLERGRDFRLGYSPERISDISCMVRNLVTMMSRPARPMRFCRNSTGAPSRKRIASAHSAITGKASGSSASASRKSARCLTAI